jgi:purine-binding chemotaxis protein CheW
VAAGAEVAKILDVWPLLDAAFVRAPRSPRASGDFAAAPGQLAGARARDEDVERLVSFEVAGQAFALPLADVVEIVSRPESLAATPRAEALVLGVGSYRDALLPLLSLRGLLGFLPAAAPDAREKLLVVRVGGALAGLAVDAVHAIVAAESALVEPTPPVLAARTAGETRIKAIYRGDQGRRLISILSKDQLFGEDVMQRLAQSAGGPPKAEAAGGQADEELRLLVFRLGDEEFGLPIEAVDEVARVPDQITRVPKTPKFLEGVVNLRGEVLPVIDQRRRFDMPPAARPEARRLVVVRTGGRRAGLIVDSVSEVLRSTADAVEPAPDLTGETTRLVLGIVNLDAVGRLVLLLDPGELLTRAERSLLEAFQTSTDPVAT